MNTKTFFSFIICTAIASNIFGQKPMHNWTGFYIGPNAGVGLNKLEFGSFISDIGNASNVTAQNGSIIVVPGTSMQIPAVTTPGHIAFVGGLQIGYTKQFNKLVAGIEGDIERFSLTGSQNYDSLMFLTAVQGISPFGFHRTANTKWIESVRLKLGYAMNQSLIYATVGADFSNITVTAKDYLTVGCCGVGAYDGPSKPPSPIPPGTIFAPANNNETNSVAVAGLTFGAGYEWAVSDNISLAVEYRHSSVTRTFTSTAIPPGTVTPNQPDAISGSIGSNSEKIKLKQDGVSAKVNINLRTFSKENNSSKAKNKKGKNM